MEKILKNVRSENQALYQMAESEDSVFLLRKIDLKFGSSGLASELFDCAHSKLFPGRLYEISSLRDETSAVIDYLSKLAELCETKIEFIKRVRE